MSAGLFVRNDARRPGLLSFIAAAALGLAVTAAPAQAEENPVSGTGKGIVGGALLGGEIVSLTMGAVGVDQGWPYFLFGGLGAVGGGVGGFFIEDSADAEIPVYMLAGGMALLIPTLIVALDATAYNPADGEITTEPASDVPAGGGVSVGGAISKTDAKPAQRMTTEQRVARIPLSLVDMREGQVALSVPAVAVLPVYSQREQVAYGVAQGTEVRVPVFQAQF